LKIFNDAECNVCMVNKVNILLHCKHATICSECLLTIMKPVKNHNEDDDNMENVD